MWTVAGGVVIFIFGVFTGICLTSLAMTDARDRGMPYRRASSRWDSGRRS
jgi:hypothetical protein